MDQLSLSKYGWKCVLGSEVAYLICLLGGLLPIRSATAMELHHQMFEILPGFTWLNLWSVVLGAIYMFVFAWIFAWYYVWMHNTSMVRK